MKRLTTDHPDGNFETMLNWVYGKDGWAHIRHDGEHEDVELTDWAKRQCRLQGCDEVWMETPEEIDDVLCDCMMDCPHCPIALAYAFASQAVHMRSRLKLYEDVLFDEAGKELLSLDDLRKLAVSNAPLTLEELREMDGEPVWVVPADGKYFPKWMIVDTETEVCRNPDRSTAAFETLGKAWTAYRRKPEEKA